MLGSGLAMTRVDDFGSDWQQITQVQFTQRREVEEGTVYCPAAHEFAGWVETYILSVKKKPKEVEINQAKLNLADKYWEYYVSLSKSHQNQVGERGHLCIFHVFKQAYFELNQLLRLKAPPPLYIVETKTVIQEKIIEQPVTHLLLGDEEFGLR